MKKNLKRHLVYCIFGMLIHTISAAGKPEISIQINKYDVQRYNKLIHSFSSVIADTEADRVKMIAAGDGVWEVKSTRNPVSMLSGATEMEIVCKLISGKESNSAVSVEFLFDSWTPTGYVLLPAAAYDGNRFDWRRIAYSPKLNDSRDIGAEKPVIISDVPKLNNRQGPSFIQERSGSMSIPALGMFHNGSGYFIVTEQANRWGDLGINFEELKDGGCVVSLVSPLVRERYKYEIADNLVASPDLPQTFQQGDEVRFRFWLLPVQGNGIHLLFHAWLNIWDTVADTNSVKNRYPFTECFNTIEEKFNKQNYVPEWGYYSVGMRENFLQDWQIGWTGGMISTYPLLFSGKEETKEHVLANFDWLFPAGISPSGFFWDSGEGGNKWYGGDIRRPMTQNWHLIRKSGDALYYIYKQFALMQKRDIEIKNPWNEGARKVTDAFVTLYDKWGQFGQFIDSRNGDIVVGGSTSGAIVPAALVLGKRYFGENEYLRVAEQSAQYMYDHYLSKGISCGGPGDALQNPDSESWYAMLESFMLLYEETGEKKWLKYAEETAAQFSTWVMAYDYDFPPESLFGQMQMQTTGAVFANTQNKHGSPGICTHSGLALLRLFRATQNPVYVHLLSQISRCIPQYMSHPDRIVGEMPAGWISERISTTDWFEGIGEIPGGSTWAETSMLLTAVELPSIYVDTEKETCYVFDHLEAGITKKNNKLILKITNPTAYPATAKIYFENAEQRTKPWIDTCLFGEKNIQLKPGETKVIKISK